jgi:hypothetical protein
MSNYQQECFPVYWKNTETNKRFSAGIAVFNPEKGEYRLKIDSFANHDIYYLRPQAAQEGKTYFVLEKVLENRHKKWIKRSKVAEGVGDKIIEMDIPPYSNYRLVVCL